MIKKILFALLPILFISCHTPTQTNDKEKIKNDSIHTVLNDSLASFSSKNEQNSRPCNVCHINFTHNGYEEESEGVWKPLSYPYSNQICSEKCGIEHTRKTYELIDEAYDKYNNGINPTSKNEYQTGNDGRIYETKKCSLCFGEGYTTYIDPITGQKGQEICAMCSGNGHLSF